MFDIFFLASVVVLLVLEVVTLFIEDVCIEMNFGCVTLCVVVFNKDIVTLFTIK